LKKGATPLKVFKVGM